MSNHKNPFQEMENQQIRSFAPEAQRSVKSGVDGTIGTSRMLGNITEIYLSRFLDTVFGMSASREDDPRTGPGRNDSTGLTDKKYPNL